MIEHNERSLLLVLLRITLIRLERYFEIERDKTLILPHLQKSNRVGVKKYALAPKYFCQLILKRYYDVIILILLLYMARE